MSKLEETILEVINESNQWAYDTLAARLADVLSREGYVRVAPPEQIEIGLTGLPRRQPQVRLPDVDSLP